MCKRHCGAYAKACAFTKASATCERRQREGGTTEAIYAGYCMLDTRYLMEKTDKESYFCFLFSDFCFLQISFNNERLISHFSFLTAAKYNIHTETEIK
jgi:hypothetical protein